MTIRRRENALTIATLIALCGCPNQDPALTFSRATACDASCIADPVPRCVKQFECATSADCNSGMTCNTVLEDDAMSRASDAGGDANDGSPSDAAGARLVQRCGLARSTDGDAFALVNGFSVGYFEIQRTPNSIPASFTWAVPADAVAVECALFTCMPEVRWDEALQRTLIVNSDQCALVHSYRLDRLDLAHTSNTAGAPPKGRVPIPNVCRPTERYARNVTALRVGCLAYSSTALIAASQLVPIEPSDAQILGDVIAKDCRDAEGLSCYFSDTRQFGTCDRGECRSRCLTSSDCGGPQREDAGGAPAECLFFAGAGVARPFGLCAN